MDRVHAATRMASTSSLQSSSLLIHHSRDSAKKQWAETQVITLHGTGEMSTHTQGEREGGNEKREGEREGGKERGSEGRRERGRERMRKGGKEGQREGGRERKRNGGRREVTCTFPYLSSPQLVSSSRGGIY